MTCLRALGYGALVTVVVFYYIAVPTLRGLFGPVAVLPAYVAVALLAGVVTYHAVRFLSDRDGQSDAGDGFAGAGALEESSAPDDADDREVDDLLGELEAEREE